MTKRPGAIVIRNTLLGVALGVLFLPILPRRGSLGWDLVDSATLGLCFAFVTWATELALRAVPGIDSPGGWVVRAAGWFAGGLWAFLAGRILWQLYGRDTTALPALAWGGVVGVTLEVALHGVPKMRGWFGPGGAR